jgi:glycosyltransferase involved in cell wall biosynthesis
MIPTYNCAQHLEAALRSVLDQDPGPERMQIEVVDDASSDFPEAVVERVGRGRVGFHRQPTNLGHTANFSTAIERSRGELVHLLHGDDAVLPGFYQRLEMGFAADPEVGAAFCRTVMISAEGHWLSISPLEQQFAGVLQNAMLLLASRHRIYPPSMVVRRSAYELLGSYHPDLRACGEDWEMYVRIASRFSVWHEPGSLALYRIHSDSLLARNVANGACARDSLRALRIFKTYLPNQIRKQAVANGRRSIALWVLSGRRGGESASGLPKDLLFALRCSTAPDVWWTAARVLVKSIASRRQGGARSVATEE